MRTRWVTWVLAAVALAGAVIAAEEPEPVPADAGMVQGDYAPYPNPGAGYVTDLAGRLTVAGEEQIERWLWQTESRTGVEIIVMVIDSISDHPGTANASIERFATGLFDAYGIGNLPANDGVLLLVAVRDRKARIELGAAYGRERDDDAAKIMQGTIVPRFKKDDYAGGIREGVRHIMREFAHVRVGVNWQFIIPLAAIPVVGLIAYSLFKSGKRGWGWVCVGIIFILLLVVLRILHGMVKHAPRGSSSSWSSGGLGGFGGGFSGGGGATGSW